MVSVSSTRSWGTALRRWQCWPQMPCCPQCQPRRRSPSCSSRASACQPCWCWPTPCSLLAPGLWCQHLLCGGDVGQLHAAPCHLPPGRDLTPSHSTHAGCWGSAGSTREPTPVQLEVGLLPRPAGDQGSPAHHPDGTSELLLGDKWSHCPTALLVPVTHITPGPLEQAALSMHWPPLTLH